MRGVHLPSRRRFSSASSRGSAILASRRTSIAPMQKCAPSERDVCGLALDVERAGAREPARVAVRGADHRQHELAGGNGPAVQRHDARGLAEHELDGRTVTQHFLDGGRQQRRIRAHRSGGWRKIIQSSGSPPGEAARELKVCGSLIDARTLS